jgi:hypothetical protein
MTENFSNDFSTTLNGAIADGITTSITVLSGAGAPAANFRIRIDNELLLVTSVGAGTNWTVVRGIEVTSAVSHLTGATVAHTITLGGLQQYLLENYVSGNAPAATGTDTYAANYSPAVGAYVTNAIYEAVIANANTLAAPTIAFNGLAAKTIVNPDGSALFAGQLVAGAAYAFLYDGTNMRVMGILPDFTATDLYLRSSSPFLGVI